MSGEHSPARTAGRAILLAGVFAAALCAQFAGGFRVQGEVKAESPVAFDRLSVVLVDSAGHRTDARAYVHHDGSFAFRGVEAGAYELRVVNLSGDVIAREFVSVHDALARLEVRLPELKSGIPSSGSVSVKRLRHEVPGKARKEFERAMAAVRKNDDEKAVRHLEKAIAIDPEYMEAHNNLGVRRLQSGNIDEALKCFEKAVELDPGSGLASANAAAVLLLKRRYPEAERTARRALSLNSSLGKARFILALALVNQGKDLDEADHYFRQVMDEFPQAHLPLADILARRGDRDGARDLLEEYLDKCSPAPRQRQVAEALLSRLNGSN